MDEPNYDAPSPGCFLLAVNLFLLTLILLWYFGFFEVSQ